MLQKILLKDGDLVLWDLETNETTILVSHDLLTSFDGGAQFQGFSPDNKLLLFASNISNVWRHSFTAVYTAVKEWRQTLEMLEANRRSLLSGEKPWNCAPPSNDVSRS